MLAFYLLGLLKDKEIVNYSTVSIQLLTLCVTLVLCIIKSFWGMAISPFYNVMGAKLFAAIVCMLVKITVVIALTLCMNNAADLARQRDIYFYKGETKLLTH
jgi:uncharacterized membrane protein